MTTPASYEALAPAHTMPLRRRVLRGIAATAALLVISAPVAAQSTYPPPPPPDDDQTVVVPPPVQTPPAPAPAPAPAPEPEADEGEPTPVGTPGGQLPTLVTGETLLLIDGVEVAVTISVSEDGGTLSIVGDGFALRLRLFTADGSPREIDADGRLVVTLDESVEVSGDGFAPGARIAVWVFSEPQLLGTPNVGADGSFRQSFVLPTDLEVGPHVLQINGEGPDGSQRSLSFGIAVEGLAAPEVPPLEAAPEGPAVIDAGDEAAWESVWTWVAVGGALLLYVLIRRRKREEPAATSSGA